MIKFRYRTAFSCSMYWRWVLETEVISKFVLSEAFKHYGIIVFSFIMTGYRFKFIVQVFGPSRTYLTAIKKIGLLFLLSPLTNIGYVTCNNVLQSKPLDYTINQIKNDVPRIVLTGYLIWLPAHLVLLTVVPLRHRVFFSNLVGVLWTCYLTYVTNTGVRREVVDHDKGSYSA